jgi:hypothetical protein
MRRSSTGNVPKFLCWMWKPYLRVVFRRCRLVSVLFYIREVCCLWRVLTCVKHFDECVASVLRKCVCASLVSCQDAAGIHEIFLGALRVVYKDRGYVSLRVVNVTWVESDPFDFIFYLFTVLDWKWVGLQFL